MNEKQIPLFDAGDRRILAVLFAAGEPLELERLAGGLGVDKAAMRQTLERLRGRLREAGLPFELLELEENVQLATAEEYSDLIRSVLSQKRSTPLSQSAMEVLAIIAYNQPVTRAFVADPGCGFQLSGEFAGGTGSGGGSRTAGTARTPHRLPDHCQFPAVLRAAEPG